VNIDALEESELGKSIVLRKLIVHWHIGTNGLAKSTATNPRYASENDLTGKGYVDSEGDQDDDYGDGDFELDQTTVGGLEIGRASTAGSESTFGNEFGLLESSKSAVETPFVSQFEKMKV
jgi:hypothetical protein